MGRLESPDSGYSWVVVFCCAYVHFALFGIFRSAGVMYVAMLQSYDVTREEASWPFALAAAVFQIAAPATSVLTHYISQRKTCILGAAIATIGVSGCYFARSIFWINISYGVIHGIGFGILATLLTVTLNQYFVKYRATAIGIAFSGGSVSSLVFPLVMEWMLEHYSLNDSFLLLSGAVMNTLVAASLLRAPPWIQKTSKHKQASIEEPSEAKDSGVSTSEDPVAETKKSIPPTVYQLAPQAEPEDSDIEDNIEIASSQEMSTFVSNLPKDSQTSSKEESPDSVKNLDTVCSNNDSVLFGGSYSKLNAHSKNNEFEVKEPLICDKQIIIVPKKDVKKLAEKSTSENSLRHALANILTQAIFYKIALTMCVYFLGVHSTFMVIVDFAKDKGIPEEKGVFIISMFSFTDLIGRAGLGWVTDRNYIGRKEMVCLNLAILGIVYQLYPLINALTGMLVIAAIQGLAVGCSITLFFVIQVESMGLKHLTLVVGLTSFINGVASLLRPGVIGMFRDVIGSYNWMFHFIGAATLINALTWFFEIFNSKKRISTKDCDVKNVV